MNTYDLVLDEEFRDLIPPAAKESDERLKSSILRAGRIRERLKVWKEKNTLIDGYRRYSIGKALDVEYDVEYLSFPDRESAMEWMLADEQLARRNLLPPQYAILSGKLLEIAQKKAKLSAAVKDVAAQTGKTTRTVYRHRNYTDALGSLPADIQKKLKNGDVPSTLDSVMQLAECEPQHQKALVAMVECGAKSNLSMCFPKKKAPAAPEESAGPVCDTMSQTKPKAKPAADVVQEAQMHLGKFAKCLDEISEMAPQPERYRKARDLTKQLGALVQQWWKEVE